MMEQDLRRSGEGDVKNRVCKGLASGAKKQTAGQQGEDNYWCQRHRGEPKI